MKKKKVDLYQEMQFDSYAYAVDVKEQAERKIAINRAERLKGFLPLLVGFIWNIANTFWMMFRIESGMNGSVTEIMGPSVLVLLIAVFIVDISIYRKIGGVAEAFQWVVKIGTWGWYIIPIFPIDICIFLVCIIYGAGILIFIPAIICVLNIHQGKKELAAAEEYLKYFKPVETEANI